MTAPLADRYGRPFRSLRISVTDRCNLRCAYCMPEEHYVWLPRESLLTFEEITRLTAIMGPLGVSRVRLTGGEPLLRRDLDHLVANLAALPSVSDLALTTNGMLLAGAAPELRAAGLRRVTVSLDTLRPERFEALSRSTRLTDVLGGIAAAREAGFDRLKLNSVIIRGFNDDELFDLVEFARQSGAEPRFIEYMDVGGATRWSEDAVVPRAEILLRLSERYGPLRPVPSPDPHAPAERWTLPDGTVVGIIASTTAPFCGDCDRARLTADGMLLTCLYADGGIDLRGPLRAGASDQDVAALLAETWHHRSDRGAEHRLAMPARAALYPIGALRADPHREMHTRGG